MTGDGEDRLNDRIDAWSDHAAGSLADHPKRTVTKWIVAIVGVCLLIGIVGGVISWAGSWGSEAKRVVSPANVTEQYQVIISDWQGAQAAADNACTAVTSATSANDPVLVENPATAYAATFRRIVVDYNTRYLNIFQAKLVGPAGYPRPFPEELQPHGAKPDWCSISTNMQSYHP